jgi:hypothetical protein
MAITMWDHLIPGLVSLRKTRYPSMDMTYFTFHRELEESHEQAMKNAVQAVDGDQGLDNLPIEKKQEFRRGMVAVLDYLAGFWMGLEQRRPAPDRSEVGASRLSRA